MTGKAPVRPERSAEGAKSKDRPKYRPDHPSTPALRAYAQDERE
jgi:hypothetical protein